MVINSVLPHFFNQKLVSCSGLRSAILMSTDFRTRRNLVIQFRHNLNIINNQVSNKSANFLVKLAIIAYICTSAVMFMAYKSRLAMEERERDVFDQIYTEH